MGSIRPSLKRRPLLPSGTHVQQIGAGNVLTEKKMNNPNKNRLHDNGRRGIKEDILRLRNEGYSYRDIQEKLKCSKSTINFHCEKEKLTDTGMKMEMLDEKTKNAILEYTKTKTTKQAMEHFGLGRTTIKRYKFKSEENAKKFGSKKA